MSILIKGMKMPKDKPVTINIWADGHVYILGKNPMMLHDAAVELPDHGDLIDRDAMRKDWKFSDSCNRCERDAYRCQYHEEMSTMDVCGMLDDAPVVIPAERSEE